MPKAAKNLAPDRYIVSETEGTLISSKVSCLSACDQGRESHSYRHPAAWRSILESLLV